MTLTGDAQTVLLKGASGTVTLASGKAIAVTAGAWQVVADFGGGQLPLISLSVPETGSITLKCQAAFQNCAEHR